MNLIVYQFLGMGKSLVAVGHQKENNDDINNNQSCQKDNIARRWQPYDKVSEKLV